MREAVRDWIRSLERAAPEEMWAALCFVAGRDVALEPAERHAALRRAELLLAAGGDPRRTLELYGRAVTAVAADLDAPDHRATLREGLEAMADDVAGLRGASEARRLLLADGDLAWQAFAMSLLAEALAGDDG